MYYSGKTGIRSLVAASAISLVLASWTAHAGTIGGKAVFQGSPPEMPAIDMAADPNCVKLNPDGKKDETVLVGTSGGLANVFVYIKDGLGDETFEKPTDPVVIDQNKCMYRPRVLGARAGQTIQIHNSDNTLHNVHAFPKKSRQFNQAMPIPGMTLKKRFIAPEVMVRIKCDVHAWMAAYVGVLKHPFFATSDTDGSFRIENVPAGTYTLEAWHEALGTQTAEVTVSGDGEATTDFSFAAAE